MAKFKRAKRKTASSHQESPPDKTRASLKWPSASGFSEWPNSSHPAAPLCHLASPSTPVFPKALATLSIKHPSAG